MTDLLSVNDKNLRSKLIRQLYGAGHEPQHLEKEEVSVAVAVMLVMGYLEGRRLMIQVFGNLCMIRQICGCRWFCDRRVSLETLFRGVRRLS